jgi:hypothetical protein
MASILHHLAPIIDKQTELVDVSPTAADDLVGAVLTTVEVLSRNIHEMPALWHETLQVLLPAAAGLLESSSPEAQLNSLHVVSNVIFAVLSPPEGRPGSGGGEVGAADEGGPEELAELSVTAASGEVDGDGAGSVPSWSLDVQHFMAQHVLPKYVPCLV